MSSPFDKKMFTVMQSAWKIVNYMGFADFILLGENHLPKVAYKHFVQGNVDQLQK